MGVNSEYNCTIVKVVEAFHCCVYNNKKKKTTININNVYLYISVKSLCQILCLVNVYINFKNKKNHNTSDCLLLYMWHVYMWHPKIIL